MDNVKMVKFRVRAITNGFILYATYPIDATKDVYNYQREEEQYFATVDVMCSFINEHFEGNGDRRINS